MTSRRLSVQGMHCSSCGMLIDEAHRGMRTAQQEKDAATIVQKFVKGSSEISPVPLIIGISATPERFEKVLEKAGRTKRV